MRPLDFIIVFGKYITGLINHVPSYIKKKKGCLVYKIPSNEIIIDLLDCLRLKTCFSLF